MKRLALTCCALLLAACRPEAPPAPGPDAAASELDRRAFLGSAGCADCHAELAAAHAGSPHALDLQPLDGAVPHADAGSPSDDAVTVTHRLGTQRRVAFLGEVGGELRVLPRAWSPTQQRWIDHRAEDGLQRDDALDWSESCAGCHPNAAAASGPQVALSPAEASGLEPGIGCEHCHGPGAAHAQLAREQPDDDDAIRGAIVLRGEDGFAGCAHCHAGGQDLPLHAGEALRAGDALSAHRLAARAVNLGGLDLRFLADGRPGRAHALTAQSFAQSRCFLSGEATCTSCHDPHGGGLKQADPDASCRGCHAAQAQDPAGHAKHPVLTGPVPLASAEPQGPEPSRAPGCVDCHAPALIVQSSVDRVRDHAFGNPSPDLALAYGVPDACTACHADESPDRLAQWLRDEFPGRDTTRLERAITFRQALGIEAAESGLEGSAAALAALAGDDEDDPWLRASATALLAGMSLEADWLGPAIADALSEDSPELAQAAALAAGRHGRPVLPELERLARAHEDWRVRVVLAASLDRLGSAAGASELEVIVADESVPAVGRAQARLQLGLALLRRGLLERAAFQLERSLELEPESIPAWLNLGVARAGYGDTDGARLAWLTVLDLEPENGAARANLLRLDQEAAGAP